MERKWRKVRLDSDKQVQNDNALILLGSVNAQIPKLRSMVFDKYVVQQRAIAYQFYMYIVTY